MFKVVGVQQKGSGGRWARRAGWGLWVSWLERWCQGFQGRYLAQFWRAAVSWECWLISEELNWVRYKLNVSSVTHSVQGPYYMLHFTSGGSEPERLLWLVFNIASCSLLLGFLILSPHSGSSVTPAIWGVKPLPQSIFLLWCLTRINFFLSFIYSQGLAGLCARGEWFLDSRIRLPGMPFSSVTLDRFSDWLELQFPHL